MSVFGDEWLIINLPMWRDTNALTAYMYQGRHREMPARRREWFERVQEAMTTLWWVPKGHRPTVAEAESRLLHLRTNGPTPYAFTLRTWFPPQGSRAGARRSTGRTGLPGLGPLRPASMVVCRHVPQAHARQTKGQQVLRGGLTTLLTSSLIRRRTTYPR